MDQQSQRLEPHAPRVMWNAEFPLVAPFSLMHQAMQLSSFGQTNVEIGLRVVTAMTRGVCDYQREMASLANRAFDRKVDYGRKLMECRQTGECIELRSEYLGSMAEDYLQTASRLVETGVQASRDLLAPVLQRTEAVIEQTNQNMDEASQKRSGLRDVA